jgi:hypothetical protein
MVIYKRKKQEVHSCDRCSMKYKTQEELSQHK